MTTPKNLPARPAMLTLSIAIAAVLATAAPMVRAQSLVELYESARSYDAAYQSAKLQYDANLAKADQAKAGLLPTAGVSAGVTRTGFENTAPTIDRSFNTQNATLSASQPLYRPANWATWEQAAKQVEQSQAQLETANQDLIVRTSQAYFDVLAAQDTLTFVRAQKTAVAEQLASAKRNFEVGTSTITDTREAQSRYDLVIAQEIAAENDLRVKKLALDTLVGKTEAQPKPLLVPVILPAVEPADINTWVQQSEVVHPNIRLAQSGVEIAELEVKKAEAGHKPTVDLQASYNVTRNPSGTASTIPPFAFRTNTTTVGVVLNVPLFAGFATQNRVRETLSLRDKAQSDLEGTRRNVAQATRAAFFGVQSGQGQVKALEAAELSSQSALDANKLGYQVGVRINIDVLNSQSQLFQTKRDLAKARYDVLMGDLKLRQANGTLVSDDLQKINSLLSTQPVSAVPITMPAAPVVTAAATPAAPAAASAATAPPPKMSPPTSTPTAPTMFRPDAPRARRGKSSAAPASNGRRASKSRSRTCKSRSMATRPPQPSPRPIKPAPPLPPAASSCCSKIQVAAGSSSTKKRSDVKRAQRPAACGSRRSQYP
jgi:outer membrane protein